jgi:hypothetical protein
MHGPNRTSTPNVSFAILLSALIPAGSASAQQATPIGRTSAKEVNVSGAVEVRNGEMLLGNGSAITAGDQAVDIALTRGGQLKLCSTTAVHLSHDKSIDAPDSTALMVSLDRGAIEANYDAGKYSDVLLTPDLRVLISGPGHTDLKVRVNARGDTCIDNHGANAPYITVSSQFDGGLYRIQPNQHVTFERGSLSNVVDTETEPCGCPAPPIAVADSAMPSSNAATPEKPGGGSSSNPADTTFPLAVSEGLAPPPGLPTVPVAKPGEVHAQATVPLAYNGDGPPRRTHQQQTRPQRLPSLPLPSQQPRSPVSFTGSDISSRMSLGTADSIASYTNRKLIALETFD